jgi:predicted nucleic acid-binding protein
MTALLDVNTLVALMDPKHLHHGRARPWWAAHRQALPGGADTG